MSIGTYTRMYADGEVIFRENSTGKEVYFIVTGKVVISQRIGGRTIAMATLEESDFFGEMAALTGESRSMTVTAIGDVYLWRLTPNEMLEYMQGNHRFAVRVCTKLAERLSHTNLLVATLIPKQSSFLRGMAIKMDTDSEEDAQQKVINRLRETIKQKDREIEILRKQLEQSKDRPPFLRSRRGQQETE
jgi:CRP-like cAMP-binding protein